MSGLYGWEGHCVRASEGGPLRSFPAPVGTSPSPPLAATLGRGTRVPCGPWDFTAGWGAAPVRDPEAGGAGGATSSHFSHSGVLGSGLGRWDDAFAPAMSLPDDILPPLRADE